MDSDDTFLNIVRCVGLVLIGLYVFWIFAVPPLMNWLSANAFTLMVIGGVVLTGIVGFGYWWVREDAWRAERLAAGGGGAGAERAGVCGVSAAARVGGIPDDGGEDRLGSAGATGGGRSEGPGGGGGAEISESAHEPYQGIHTVT